MGVEVRRDRLLHSASDEQRRKDIESGVERLISPTGMGSQYKCLAIATANPEDPNWVPYPFKAPPAEKKSTSTVGQAPQVLRPV